MVRVWNLLRQLAKRICRADGTVHVLVAVLVALRSAESSKTSLKSHFDEGNGSQGVEGVVVLSELFDQLVPSVQVVQFLKRRS